MKSIGKESKVLSVRMGIDLLKIMDELAAERSCKRSDILRMMVLNYLEENGYMENDSSSR